MDMCSAAALQVCVEHLLIVSYRSKTGKTGTAVALWRYCFEKIYIMYT